MTRGAGPVETDEQGQIRQTVAAVLDHHARMTTTRRMMVDPTGYDRALWRRMSQEIGVGAMAVPESRGGLGLGLADAAVVIEELGRRLVPGPWIETLATAWLLAPVATDCADSLIDGIMGGAAVSVAIGTPGADDDPVAGRPSVTVASSGSGPLLAGRVAMVPFGASADTLVIAATGADGPALYAVQHDDLADRTESVMTLDQTRRLATIELTGVPARRISGSDSGADEVRLLEDLLAVGIAVESVGAAEACLEMTVSYLKVREQFGRPLGSFQALKHRCADHAVAVHGARAATRAAVHTTDSVRAGTAGPRTRCTDAAVATVAATETFWQVAADTIQLHGGIGFTFEHDAHLYVKRAKANQHLYGTTAHWRARIAEAMDL